MKLIVIAVRGSVDLRFKRGPKGIDRFFGGLGSCDDRRDVHPSRPCLFRPPGARGRLDVAHPGRAGAELHLKLSDIPPSGEEESLDLRGQACPAPSVRRL